jgi:hypothetical protein
MEDISSGQDLILKYKYNFFIDVLLPHCNLGWIQSFIKLFFLVQLYDTMW